MSLEKLKMIYHSNFSFNKFSGAVPKGGIFKNLGAMEFMVTAEAGLVGRRSSRSSSQIPENEQEPQRLWYFDSLPSPEGHESGSDNAGGLAAAFVFRTL